MRRKVMTAFGWSMLDGVGRQVLSLVFFLLAARLIPPAEVGIFLLCIVIIELAKVLIEDTLTEPLVRRPRLTSVIVDTYFWLTAAVSGAVLLVLASSSWLLTLVPDRPQIHEVLRVLPWLCLTCFAGTLGAVPLALLRRSYRFRRVAVRGVATQVASGVAVTAFALAGFGVWSLVAGQAAATAVSLALAMTAVPWRPRLRFSRACLEADAAYIRNVAGMRLAQFARAHLDKLLIGVLLGPVMLAYFGVAVRIVNVFAQSLLVNINQVNLVVLSKAAGRNRSLAAEYERILKLSLLLLAPPLAGIAGVGDLFVEPLLGSAWIPSGDLLLPLAIVGMGTVVLEIGGTVLRAAGDARRSAALSVGSAAADLAIIAAACSVSLHAVAVALAVKATLQSVLVLAIVHRALWSRPADLARALAPSLAVSLAVFAASTSVPSVGWTSLALHLGILTVACTAVYGAGLGVFLGSSLPGFGRPVQRR